MSEPGPLRVDLSVAAAHLHQRAREHLELARTASDEDDVAWYALRAVEDDAVAVLLEAIAEVHRKYHAGRIDRCKWDSACLQAAGVAAVVVPEEAARCPGCGLTACRNKGLECGGVPE